MLEVNLGKANGYTLIVQYQDGLHPRLRCINGEFDNMFVSIDPSFDPRIFEQFPEEIPFRECYELFIKSKEVNDERND